MFTVMKRDRFLRDLKGYCRKNGLTYAWDAGRGKGSHGTVFVGPDFTTVQVELSEGRIEAILKQLGLPKDAI